MTTCDTCPNPADPGYHVELEHPQDGQPALAVRTLCEECAEQTRNLLELVGERVTLTAYYCPACETFDVTALADCPDTCLGCDGPVEVKPLTERTVFSNARRTDAKVIG